MRIVQTLWFRGLKNYLSESCGWLAPEYNLMSWALSCLQLKRFYNDVVLYADSASAKILADILKLPYTEVVCSLDALSNHHRDLYALPKILTYSVQDKPFLHVDGDIFIWKAFDAELIKSGLIAQNKEIATEFYNKIFSDMETGLSYLPKEIKEERKRKEVIYAYNAGILGGCDLDFFQTYSEKAIEFVNANLSSLNRINVYSFNVSFEQYLFYCVAKSKEKKVNVLFSELIDDNRYTSFGNFSEVPYSASYIHLIGRFKVMDGICNQMAFRLRQDYPEYYYRIIELFARKKLPLFKNYYYFLDAVTESGLLNRNIKLQQEYNRNELSKAISPDEQKRIAVKHVELKNDTDNEFIVEDVIDFNIKLSNIVLGKFSAISHDYLYARDLACTGYAAFMFSDITTIYNKVIARGEDIEIVQSKYNLVQHGEFLLENPLNEHKLSGIFHTAVIPECHKSGFSLVRVDELDLLILETLQTPLTITRLLDELKKSFDPDDLADSLPQFEKLIFGRIEIGFIHKTIRCITTSYETTVPVL